MRLKYGSYIHAQGEASLSVRRSYQRDEADRVQSVVVTWDISGQVIAPTQEDLLAKLATLEAAYAVDGQDASLLMPTSSQAVLSLPTATALGGVRVSAPISYPNLTGGVALVTLCPYTVSLEAVYSSAAAHTVLAWQETVESGGGGPDYEYLQPLYGPPIRQQTRQQTVWRASQRGSAVGYGAYPVPPAPIWPAAERPALRSISRSTPRRTGSRFVEYPITWSYTFEWHAPLSGQPNFWR